MANLIVTNLNDSGAGSLRQALADAGTSAGADTVTFAAGLSGGTIRLQSQLVISSGVVDIDGDLDNDGDADITLSGDSNNSGIADDGDTRILRIAAGSDVSIDGLVLTRGFAVGADGIYGSPNGAAAGGAFENFGTLAIANSVFLNNSATGGVGYDGFRVTGGDGGNAAGAILNAGALTVTDTQFAGNRAVGGRAGHGFDGYSFEDGSTGYTGGGAAAGILNLAPGVLGLSGAVFLGGESTGGGGGTGGTGGRNLFTYGDGGDGGVGGDAAAGIINHGGVFGNLSAEPGTATPGAGGAGGAPGSSEGGFGAPGPPGLASGIFLNFGTGTVAITQLGTAAADTFSGTSDIDRYKGLDGDDTMSGLGANDVLSGGDGNDALDGGNGADSMAGGLGNDTYVVDDAGDTIAELLNQGYDTVNTTRTSFILGANIERVNFVGVGNFVGTGNALNNRFQGGAGNDRFVDVLGGADIFSGGAGTDTLDFRGNSTAVILNFITNVHTGAALGDSFSSIEKFLGSLTGDDRMSAGGTGRVIYAGYGGDDRLNGGVKNDQLLGGDGNDILKGNAERDALDGGAGNDTMTGGSDADAFDYSAAGFGQDVITDFEDGLDRFRMSSAVADDVSDFTITGNGTNTIVMTLVTDPLQTITLNGVAAITVTATDFEFY